MALCRPRTQKKSFTGPPCLAQNHGILQHPCPLCLLPGAAMDVSPAFTHISSSCTPPLAGSSLSSPCHKAGAFTFVSILKACANFPDLVEGMMLHAVAEERGFTRDIYVGSTLVNMYGKSGSLAEAEGVFFQLPQRNVVSWNALLASYVGNGEVEKAMKLYRQMHHEGVSANSLTYVAMVKACSFRRESEDLGAGGGEDFLEKRWRYCEIGRGLHADARRKGSPLDAFVGNTLLNMYGRWKFVEEAENVFIALPKRSLVSWNVMLSAYRRQCDNVKVLQCYGELLEEGIAPDHETLMIALQACSGLEDLGEKVTDKSAPFKICQAIHAEAWVKGFRSDVIIASMLISMYCKHGDIMEAESVFAALSEADVGAWNAMLSGYVKLGQEHKALRLYAQMEARGIVPDELTFMTCFQACGSHAVKDESARLIALEIGKEIHGDAWRTGFASRIYVSNTLISMYGKCGTIPEAENVFRGMQEQDIVSWNALLSVYVEQGQGHLARHLYLQMHSKGVVSDVLTLATALQACGNLVDDEEYSVLEGSTAESAYLDFGRTLHDEALLKGFDSDVFVRSTLLNMYYKCGKLMEAENTFLRAPKQDVVLFNVMISAYLEHGERRTALQLYRLMLEQSDYLCNERTFVLVLRACCPSTKDLIDENVSAKAYLQIGQAVHLHAWTKGYASNIFVSVTLISMYSKCGCIPEAEYVFGMITRRNVVAWNTMLAGYLESDEGWKTLQLFREMQQDTAEPDRQTLVTALQACCVLAERQPVEKEGKPMKKIVLEIGRALHIDAISLKDVVVDAFVSSALVSMYGKCSALCDAEATFGRHPERNLMAWNAMICIYVEQKHYEKAIHLYTKMTNDGQTINDATLVCILQASIGIGSLELCHQIHFIITFGGKLSCSLLLASLIHAYGNAACMADAMAVFDGLFQPDVVAWSSCIAGFGREGNYEASIQVLEKMSMEGIAADEVAYSSFLSSCSHTGHVDTGIEIFDLMTKGCAMKPELKHYGSVIDLLGRAGHATRVEGLLKKSPVQPDIAIWLSLLSACCVHSNMELAMYAFKSVVHLQPGHPSGYALMEKYYRQLDSLKNPWS